MQIGFNSRKNVKQLNSLIDCIIFNEDNYNEIVDKYTSGQTIFDCLGKLDDAVYKFIMNKLGLDTLYANPTDNTLYTKKDFSRKVGYNEWFDIFARGCYILWNGNRYIPICYKTLEDNGNKYK